MKTVETCLLSAAAGNHCGFIRNIAFLVLLLIPTVARSLWPIPRTLQTGSKALKLSPNFTINFSFQDVPLDLSDAVLRTKSFLINDKLQVVTIDLWLGKYWHPLMCISAPRRWPGSFRIRGCPACKRPFIPRIASHAWGYCTNYREGICERTYNSKWKLYTLDPCRWLFSAFDSELDPWLI